MMGSRRTIPQLAERLSLISSVMMELGAADGGEHAYAGKATHRVEVDQIDADEIGGGDERVVGPRGQIQQPAGQNLAEDAQEYPAQPHAQR